MKYENKVVSKILFPLGVGVLLISLFGSLMLKLNLSITYWLRNNLSVAGMIQTMAIVLFVFSVIAIISASFVSIFILMQRYYKNLFTDEGYLTFTLPVKTRDILLSKLFSGVIWTLFIAACTIAGVFLIVIFGTSRTFINHAALKEIKSFLQLLFQFRSDKINVPLLWIQSVILFFSSMLQQFLLIYLAITMGNQIAKKHKILASVGMYFAIYAACQTINSALMVIIGIGINNFDLLNNIDSIPMAVHWTLLFTTLLSLAYALVFFIINHSIIKNKLNLE